MKIKIWQDLEVFLKKFRFILGEYLTKLQKLVYT